MENEQPGSTKQASQVPSTSHSEGRSHSEDHSDNVLPQPIHNSHDLEDSQHSQFVNILDSIVKEINRSFLNCSFQKKDPPFELSISGIDRGLRVSLEADSIRHELNLLNSREDSEMSIVSQHLESAVAQLKDVFEKSRQKQARLQAENQQLREQLGGANETSFSMRCKELSEHEGLDQNKLLSLCLTYKDKYIKYKERCIHYRDLLNNLRSIQ